MDETGSGSLKLVVIDGDEDAASAALCAIIAAEEIRQLAAGAWLLHTALEPTQLRDRLAVALGAPATVFVVEFERWSGSGASVDAEWLLRRGH